MHAHTTLPRHHLCYQPEQGRCQSQQYHGEKRLYILDVRHAKHIATAEITARGRASGLSIVGSVFESRWGDLGQVIAMLLHSFGCSTDSLVSHFMRNTFSAHGYRTIQSAPKFPPPPQPSSASSASRASLGLRLVCPS